MSANQHLIRFENRHYVWNRDDVDETTNKNDDAASSVLEYLADCTGWPLHRLELVSSDASYSNDDNHDNNNSMNYSVVRVVSGIRGGKGGFGSLLKSQSRQAGAKATTNFGACRDLQGRRLRHVNDHVAAQHFAEWQERIDAGQATEDDMVKALVKTTSGVPGWHLQLPAWSDISKTENRKWQRQYHLWKQSKKLNQEKKRHERELRESRVQHYVDQAVQATASVQASLQSALQEGLQQQNKRQKLEKEPPTALLTLTGDVVLAPNENDVWQIQTKSNFGTIGIVLDTAKLKEDTSYYWEIRLVTGGLYAYDGSRKISLHQSESVDYGQAWNAGDVVGCLWNHADGALTFYHNGNDLGMAYKVDDTSIMFPAASCNPDEILELHLHKSEMIHLPGNPNVVPVGDVLMMEEASFAAAAGVDEAEADTKLPTKESTKQSNSSEQHTALPPVVVESLDLSKFDSVQELEALGLDRLKGALMALGVKCGGTLTQRAERLLSLKGVDLKDIPPKLLAKKK
eukprot:scaffold5610_cov157-Amphora_coffeaeformis.AAC.1